MRVSIRRGVSIGDDARRERITKKLRLKSTLRPRAKPKVKIARR